MKIHEYQAKALLAEFVVAVPRGEPASTPEEVRAAAAKLGGPVVLKAQVLAGGRGKAGGIRRAATPEEAAKIAGEMLGSSLSTLQSGPEGRVIRRLLVEEAVSIARELYVAVTVDREHECLALLASVRGGVEIESVAASSPELIIREDIHPGAGLRDYQLGRAAFALGLGGDAFKAFVRLVRGVYNAFEARDASLVEINPLVVTAAGGLIALDAKIDFDDNALARHPDIQALRDWDEEPKLEVEAARARLSYVKLDGSVGCMVNGAGLAMATMDIIQLAGGQPANFLDVGGGVTEDAVTKAFGILVADPNVKAALVNIFGGIVRCDLVAGGIVRAARAVGLSVPLVVRMEGTNAEQGRKILEESGLAFHYAADMKAAAERAVVLSRTGPGGES